MKTMILAAAIAVSSATTAFAIPADEPIMFGDDTQVGLAATTILDREDDKLINRPAAPTFGIVTGPGIICPDDGCVDGPIVHFAVNGQDGGCTEFQEELILAGEIEISPYFENGPQGRTGGVKATVRWTF